MHKHVCGPSAQRRETSVASNSSSLRAPRSTYREVQRRLFELWQAFNKKEKSHVLCHNLLGTNRPEGWVRPDRKWVWNVWAWVRIVWVRKIHRYETTGNLKKSWVHFATEFSSQLIFPSLWFLEINYDYYDMKSRKVGIQKSLTWALEVTVKLRKEAIGHGPFGQAYAGAKSAYWLCEDPSLTYLLLKLYRTFCPKCKMPSIHKQTMKFVNR